MMQGNDVYQFLHQFDARYNGKFADYWEVIRCMRSYFVSRVFVGKCQRFGVYVPLDASQVDERLARPRLV